MAVRFSAQAHTYTTNLALGSVANWSITTWAKVTVDRNTYSTLWCFDPGSTIDYRLLQTTETGTNLTIYPPSTAMVNFTVGTWYYIGLSETASGGTYRIRAQGAGTFTSGTFGVGDPPTATNLRIGASVFGTSEFLNGAMAATKIWMGTALTAAELEAEYQYKQPLKSAGVTAYYTFDTASTVDNSGNGRTLTGGVGATTEAGPTLIDVPGIGGLVNGWGPVPVK